MNLILFDGLTANENNLIESSLDANETHFDELKTFDLTTIKNYENITIYTGLSLGFVSRDFVTSVNILNEYKLKNKQIDVIFLEKLGENAKIAIDWLAYLKENYSLKFKVLAELDRENLDQELGLVSKAINQVAKEIKDNQVTIYTDGACSGNPGAGGWGAILFHGKNKKEISGFEKETTNNKMEITAVIRALEMLKAPCKVELYSDSSYVVNAITLGWLENWKANGWKGSDKKPVKNIEFWKRLDDLMQIHQVNFNKVKGHADNEFNNRCDELATGEIAMHANDL